MHKHTVGQSHVGPLWDGQLREARFITARRPTDRRGRHLISMSAQVAQNRLLGYLYPVGPSLLRHRRSASTGTRDGTCLILSELLHSEGHVNHAGEMRNHAVKGWVPPFAAGTAIE